MPERKPTIADLSMLVARLVQQVRKHEPENDVAEKAMDYLRRTDLSGSILRDQQSAMSRSVLRCPKCNGAVKAVRQTGGMAMNSHQFDAVKAGDYYCEKCPGNDRGNSKLCYWWESELGVSQ